MRKVWLFILLIVSTGCILQMADAWYQAKEAVLQSGIAQDVLRFHVRANSEDVYDQKVKMQVRDAVISYLKAPLEEARDVKEAQTFVTSHLTEIRQAAEAVLMKSGWPYGAEVSLREEYFPEKTYGDCTFPAGKYDAVVIELGSGTGRNWWCMLYPGLCFVDETHAVVSEEKEEDLQHILTEDEFDWITDPQKRRVTFRWEWIQSAVEGFFDLING